MASMLHSHINCIEKWFSIDLMAATLTKNTLFRDRLLESYRFSLEHFFVIFSTWWLEAIVYCFSNSPKEVNSSVQRGVEPETPDSVTHARAEPTLMFLLHNAAACNIQKFLPNLFTNAVPCKITLWWLVMSNLLFFPTQC